jgi:hypothetical protein
LSISSVASEKPLPDNVIVLLALMVPLTIPNERGSLLISENRHDANIHARKELKLKPSESRFHESEVPEVKMSRSAETARTRLRE